MGIITFSSVKPGQMTRIQLMKQKPGREYVNGAGQFHLLSEQKTACLRGHIDLVAANLIFPGRGLIFKEGRAQIDQPGPQIPGLRLLQDQIAEFDIRMDNTGCMQLFDSPGRRQQKQPADVAGQARDLFYGDVHTIYIFCGNIIPGVSSKELLRPHQRSV